MSVDLCKLKDITQISRKQIVCLDFPKYTYGYILVNEGKCIYFVLEVGTVKISTVR